MTYFESAKALNRLRSKDMMMFRMAISHLMDVGIRHLTEENINQTCEEIMKQDDSHSFMTNEFQCDLLRMAGELAQIDHIHLLTYISREICYDVGDNAIPYDRAIDLLKHTTQYVIDETYRPAYSELVSLDFDDSELSYLGYDNLISNEEEEE